MDCSRIQQKKLPVTKYSHYLVLMYRAPKDTLLEIDLFQSIQMWTVP